MGDANFDGGHANLTNTLMTMADLGRLFLQAREEDGNDDAVMDMAAHWLNEVAPRGKIPTHVADLMVGLVLECIGFQVPDESGGSNG